MTLNQTRSLWELNDRFAANVREMLWRIQYQNTSDIMWVSRRRCLWLMSCLHHTRSGCTHAPGW